MMKQLKEKVVSGEYFLLFKRLAVLVKHVFRHKKILIISDEKIMSVPISSRFQGMLAIVVITLMLWVSFSTGKYFAYEALLSEKEHEIWATNLDNENLQYQVSDLHRNLSELDKYFDNIKKYGQVMALEGDAVFNDNNNLDGQKYASIADGSGSASEKSAQNLLAGIRNKVSERITSLESIIKMTGLKLEEIAANNGELKRVLLEIENKEGSNQGGPLIEVDDFSTIELPDYREQAFESEINYLIELEKVIHKMPLSMPLTRYYITSKYGKRVDPMHKRIAMHNGVDLMGGYKAKVYATAPGVVTYARRNGAYGLLLEIAHGSGIATRYAHLDKVVVKRGDKVRRGQVIAIQGNTGRSTGEHLHYEVRYNNASIDPIRFLKAGKYVF